MDFKLFQHRSTNDLAKVVDQLPLKELERTESNPALMESLQRGIRQAVTLEVDRSSKGSFIEASPQYKQLNWYDERQAKLKTPSLNQSSSQEINTGSEIKKKRKEVKKRHHNMKSNLSQLEREGIRCINTDYSLKWSLNKNISLK